MITYQQLLNGYILKPGDKLDLNSHTYVVCPDCSNRTYFLTVDGEDNDVIFVDLHKNKYEWAKQFGFVRNGGFPYIDTLEHLTEFVKDIYREIEEQTLEFKKGAIITLYDIKYKVLNYEEYNGDISWFLSNCDGDNDEIFEVLGISNKEKEKIARQFGAKSGFCEKSFPEFRTANELKEFVKYLKSYGLPKKPQVTTIIQENYVGCETRMSSKESTKSIQINIPKINTKKIKL